MKQGADGDTLLAGAKSGEIGLEPIRVVVKPGKTATLKLARLIRHPENYSATPTDTARPAGKVAAASVLTPQDFSAKEVGIVYEILPEIQSDRKSLKLDFTATFRELLGFESRESESAGARPEAILAPEFSEVTLKNELVLKNHLRTFYATLPASSKSKDSRTRVIFIKADWKE